MSCREMWSRPDRPSTGWQRATAPFCYLTEQLAAQLQSEIARYQDALTPAIILIPGKEGSLGIGMANVTNAVERAVGADIL
ncbi:MAG: V-type ATP synthase subunit F [Lawsonibacter sp.]